MAGAPNVLEHELDVENGAATVRWRRGWIGRRIGAVQLGASLLEVALGVLA